MSKRMATGLLRWVCAGGFVLASSACKDGAALPNAQTIAGTMAPPAAGTTSGPSGTPAAGSGGAQPSAGGAGAPAAGRVASAGTGGAGSSAAGASGTAASAAGAGGAPTAGTAGTPAAAGAGGAAAGAGAAGAAGAPPATNTFKRGCKNGDLGPCGSFIPENEKELELGPYGAVMEVNVGKAFAYTVASGDADNNASCRAFAASFGEDPESTMRLLDTGNLDFSVYTVYRPAQFKEGEKYGVITWGNGTCAKPEGYGALLRYVASHGFIVVAPNSRWVGSGASMRKGLDFILAANDDAMSPFYQKVDATKVGAMGHSQGGMGTTAAASDARIKAVIIWNAGRSSSKPFLAVSGDTDITGATPTNMRSSVQSASAKGAFLYYHMVPDTGSASGHLTLMTQPERVAPATAAWWKFILSGDAESKTYFVGTDCKLCNMKDAFEFGQKGLE